MVQLSQSPPPPSCHRGDTSPRAEPEVEEAEHTETYPEYERYIENGLICLKHKVRNLEKKKIKLEEYRLKLNHGAQLNPDQMASLLKYEEVTHHLSFALELQHKLDALTHNLLRAQRKAQRKQQVALSHSQRSRLSTVLHMQQVLLALDRDQVQTDLVSGLHQAPRVQVQTLHQLDQLRPLLGVTRDYSLSLTAQMQRAAGLFMDLLDAKDKPVIGSTFKSLKEELSVLLDSPYFSSLPPEEKPCDQKTPEEKPCDQKTPEEKPCDKKTPETTEASAVVSASKSSSEESEKLSAQTWDLDLDAEPPDHWDSELPEQRLWRGGAALVPKNQGGGRGEGEGRRKEKKVRREESFKPVPVELRSLPTDSKLRRQRLEELLSLNTAFSFMQDSVLEGSGSPCRPHQRLHTQASTCPSSLAPSDPRSPLPTTHSTPLPPRRLEPKDLPHGDTQDLPHGDTQDLPHGDTQDLPHGDTQDLPHGDTQDLQRPKDLPQSPLLVRLKSPVAQTFITPPSRRPLPSAHFNMNAVIKVKHTLPPAGFCSSSQEVTAAVSVSTQTPPEFCPPEDDMVYADYDAGSFLSPSQSGGRPAHYHQPGRGSPHLQEPGTFYSSRAGEYQNYRVRHNGNASWSDSSLGHSPERSAFILDSGRGESLAVSSLHSCGSLDPSLLTPSLPLYPPPPLRVAFTAARTANFAPGNLDQPVVFDQLLCNHGDAYDPRLGRFTCPAAGTYVFLFHALKLAVNVPLYVNLMMNQEVAVSAYANDGAPDHETASNHSLLRLARGDAVWLRLHRGAIYGSSWKYSTFSGFLLYQD
ncbi:unnamed protein product [Knipowitschia caucasica]